MAGGSGYSHKALESARNKVESELKNLDGILAKIQKDVNTMNKDVWHGGKTANTWYEAMEKAFTKDVNYYNKVVKMQNSFSKKLGESKSKTGGGSSSYSGGGSSGSVLGSASNKGGGNTTTNTSGGGYKSGISRPAGMSDQEWAVYQSATKAHAEGKMTDYDYAKYQAQYQAAQKASQKAAASATASAKQTIAARSQNESGAVSAKYKSEKAALESKHNSGRMSDQEYSKALNKLNKEYKNPGKNTTSIDSASVKKQKQQNAVYSQTDSGQLSGKAASKARNNAPKGNQGYVKDTSNVKDKGYSSSTDGYQQQQQHQQYVQQQNQQQQQQNAANTSQAIGNTGARATQPGLRQQAGYSQRSTGQVEAKAAYTARTTSNSR